MCIRDRAYEQIAEKCEYPLHLGVTEAGTARMGPVSYTHLDVYKRQAQLV